MAKIDEKLRINLHIRRQPHMSEVARCDREQSDDNGAKEDCSNKLRSGLIRPPAVSTQRHQANEEGTNSATEGFQTKIHKLFHYE